MACDDLITNQDLENAKKDATTMSDFVESDSPNITSKNGKDIRTLQGINDAADNLISSLGGVDIGDYENDETLNSYNEYVVFDRAGLSTGPSLWKAIPPRTPTPGTPLPYTIDSTTYPDPTSDPNIEPFSDINKAGAEQIAQEESNAGDSQLAGGAIWPLSSQNSLSLGAQSTVVSIDANRFRVNTGSETELLYLWEPSGTLPSAPFTITDIVYSSTLEQYTFTIDGSDYEFLTNTVLDWRLSTDIRGWGAKNGQSISDSLDACAAYVTATRNGDLHSKTIKGEDGAEYILSRQHDLPNVSIWMPFSTLKVGDLLPDPIAINVVDTSVTKGYTLVVNIDGNKANNPTNICVNLQGITSPTNMIYIQGFDARTLVKVQGNTEKSVIQAKGIDCDILLLETESSGVGDITPDENIYEISGATCKTYYKRENSNSTSTVRFNTEQQNEADNLYAIDIQGGGKSVTISGIMRAPLNAMLFDSASHLDFDNFTLFAPRGDGPRINQCLSISGTLHVNANSDIGTSALGLILRRATNGGSLNYNQIGKSDTPNYTVRLGNETDGVSLDDVLLVMTGLDLTLDVQFAKRCGITARNLDSLRFGQLSESNDVEVGSGFMINDKPIVNAATTDYINTVRCVGSLSTTQLTSYSTPIEGMRAQSVRGAGLGRESLYTGGSWKYATYA